MRRTKASILWPQKSCWSDFAYHNVYPQPLVSKTAQVKHNYINLSQWRSKEQDKNGNVWFMFFLWLLIQCWSVFRAEFDLNIQ